MVDRRIPLKSETNRIINLVWRDQKIRPHETKTYTLAIGLAEQSPTGFPVKPVVEFN